MLTRTTPTSTSVQVRRGVRAAAAGTAALLALSLAAQPAVSATLSGQPGSAVMAAGRAGKITTEFRYTFDRRETLRPRSIVRDVTGHRNNGRVFVSNGGRLHKVTGHPGKAALFPCRGCGRAVISAPDKRFLDPGQHPFWFGATIKVRDDQALPGRDPNIMQKGVINQAGGRWKLELIGSTRSAPLRGGPARSWSGRTGVSTTRPGTRFSAAARTARSV